MRKWLLCYFLFLFFAAEVSSIPLLQLNQTQEQQQKFNQEVENIYKKLLTHYSEGRYNVVEYELQNLLELYPENHRSSSIIYLMGRAQYKQKKYSQAEDVLIKLLTKYPQSKYIDDTQFLLSAISFDRKNYFRSGEYLFSVFEETNDSRLIDRSRDLLFPLLTDYLRPDELQILKNKFQQSQSMAMVDYANGVQNFRLKNMDLAGNFFQSVLQQSPNNQLGKNAQRYLQLIDLASKNKTIKIGVLLPLSGILQEEAKSILAGIEYAFKQSQIAKYLPIKLVVEDTEGETLPTIQVCKRLLQDESIIAIIGEIESDKTAIISSLFLEKNIPVISPTAAESGLSELGDNIIQMSPDVSIRGEIIAEYAMNELNLKTFGILAPADSYGKTITDSFVETVDKLNGTILVETWYYQGATELRNQFKHIREIGLKKMGRDSVSFEFPDFTLGQIDSVILEIERQKKREQAESEEPRRMKFSDSTATPVTSIDAIFLPVYTDEISFVAPQLALYNIQCQIIGGDYWNDEEVLDRNQSYLSGCVFSSDYYSDLLDSEMQKFINRFRLDVGVTPEKMEIYGYDTMNFLLHVLNKENEDAEKLLWEIKRTNSYEGISHTYKFDRKVGVNSHLNILKYEGNTISKIK
jgi:ABC-type branched-subunit amino acid transport system substrate-binding protein